MPCSGLKSATSCTPGALCSTSIVARAVGRTAGVVGDQADALALERREAVAREDVDAGQHRCRRCRGCTRVTGEIAEVRAGHAADGRLRNARRGVASDRFLTPIAAAASVATRAAQRRDVAFAVGMQAAREEDHIAARRRIDPERRAGESGVAERADRKQLAAIRRERRVDVPAEAANARHAGRRRGRGHLARRSAGDSTRVPSQAARRRAASARSATDRARCRTARRARRHRPCAAPSGRARRRAAAARPACCTATPPSCRSVRSARCAAASRPAG